MVTVPVTGFAMKDNTPPQLAAYEPFFNMMKQDNIPVVRIKDSAGQDKMVIPVFDMAQFQNGGNARTLSDAQMSAPPVQQDLPSMGLSELLSQTAPPPVAEEPPAEATE